MLVVVVWYSICKKEKVRVATAIKNVCARPMWPVRGSGCLPRVKSEMSYRGDRNSCPFFRGPGFIRGRYSCPLCREPRSVVCVCQCQCPLVERSLTPCRKPQARLSEPFSLKSEASRIQPLYTSPTAIAYAYCAFPISAFVVHSATRLFGSTTFFSIIIEHKVTRYVNTESNFKLGFDDLRFVLIITFTVFWAWNIKNQSILSRM